MHLDDVNSTSNFRLTQVDLTPPFTIIIDLRVGIRLTYKLDLDTWGISSSSSSSIVVQQPITTIATFTATAIPATVATMKMVEIDDDSTDAR
jgi:hypothetical protein